MKFPRLILTIAVAAGALLFGWRIFQKSPATAGTAPTAEIQAVQTTESTAMTAAPASEIANTAATETEMSPATKEQVQVLTEILTSKNDNDPRMDRELKVLSKETKAAFRTQYKNLAAEKRNDRGTIVFLIGRNLQTKEDLNFMGDVLNEPPCKSISDCGKSELGGLDRDHDDHQTGMGVTLAYPQLVTIHSLKKFIQENPESPLANQAKDILAQATHSTVPEISKAAEVQ